MLNGRFQPREDPLGSHLISVIVKTDGSFAALLLTKSEHHLSAVLQSGSPLTTFWCWAQATLYQVGAVARL